MIAKTITHAKNYGMGSSILAQELERARYSVQRMFEDTSPFYSLLNQENVNGVINPYEADNLIGVKAWNS